VIPIALQCQVVGANGAYSDLQWWHRAGGGANRENPNSIDDAKNPDIPARHFRSGQNPDRSIAPLNSSLSPRSALRI